VVFSPKDQHSATKSPPGSGGVNKKKKRRTREGKSLRERKNRQLSHKTSGYCGELSTKKVPKRQQSLFKPPEKGPKKGEIQTVRGFGFEGTQGGVNVGRGVGGVCTTGKTRLFTKKRERFRRRGKPHMVVKHRNPSMTSSSVPNTPRCGVKTGGNNPSQRTKNFWVSGKERWLGSHC